MVNRERLEGALSSVHWSFDFLDAEVSPRTLIEALKQCFPDIDPKSWPERLDWGGVYINGKMKHSDMALPSPCRLEYFEPKYPFESRLEFYPAFSSSWLLYEDDDFLVSFKPVGLPCLPSREQCHLYLKAYIEKYLKRRVHMPSRLDTATSGILIMSKSMRMNKCLQQAFERRRMAKYYLLETASPPPWEERTVEAAIGKHDSHPILRAVDQEGGKEAKTSFKVICESSITDSEGNPVRTVLMRAKPLTGRTHQIRAHAAHIGIPIVGDAFYEGFAHEGLRLASYQLDFYHPFNKEDFHIVMPEALWPEWGRRALEILTQSSHEI